MWRRKSGERRIKTSRNANQFLSAGKIPFFPFFSSFFLFSIFLFLCLSSYFGQRSESFLVSGRVRTGSEPAIALGSWSTKLHQHLNWLYCEDVVKDVFVVAVVVVVVVVAKGDKMDSIIVAVAVVDPAISWTKAILGSDRESVGAERRVAWGGSAKGSEDWNRYYQIGSQEKIRNYGPT